ncbi:hypothetical protein [Nocardioides houyundeii]|uniref:hypothetical protein n=1 Tax=Nocardioides houyundeii TaxID=2045452 RepID=UPI000DF15777|nr:hypothetical protein [Nocardioides houyundeii]
MTPHTLTSRAAVERAWRNMTHGSGFTRHSIWLMVIDDEDRVVQPVIEIEDAVRPPDSRALTPFTEFLAELTRVPDGPPCRIAVLRSRPGGGGPGADDRGWAAAMAASARAAGVCCGPVHFASDDTLVALPADLSGLVSGRG